MKVVLAGGTGFLGTRLVARFLDDGHDAVLLTRVLWDEHRSRVRRVLWDGSNVGVWSREIDGADAVINLAGEPLDARRWSDAQKAKILNSRVNATRAIVEAIRHAGLKPAILVNASGVGYYGDVPDGDVTEERKQGEGFLAEICARWEAEAEKVRKYGTRVAIVRTGIALAADGGALVKMLLPFRWFVGGPFGSGRQWFPWIHVEDVIGAILHILQTPALEGPVNVTAPDPVTMQQFCLALGNALHRPSRLRVPAGVMRMALGEMAAMVLTGQKAVPQKLLDTGYKFRYSNVLVALEALPL